MFFVAYFLNGSTDEYFANDDLRIIITQLRATAGPLFQDLTGPRIINDDDDYIC